METGFASATSICPAVHLEHQPRFRHDWLRFPFGNVDCRGGYIMERVVVRPKSKLLGGRRRGQAGMREVHALAWRLQRESLVR